MSQLIKNAQREWNEKNPPRDPNDKRPRQIVAKFPGMCNWCGDTKIEPGDIIGYWPDAKPRMKIACAGCAPDAFNITLKLPPDGPKEIDMTHLESTLASLGYKQLVELFKGVAGRTFGFNYANHPDTAKKSDLIKYLIKNSDNGQLLAGAEAMLNGSFKHYEGERHNRHDIPDVQHEDDVHVPEGGESQDGEGGQQRQGRGGGGNGEGEGQSQSQSDAADELLKQIVQRGGGINEERVREIVQEEIGELPAGGGGGFSRIEIKSPKVPDGVKIDNPHPLFEKVLRLASAGINVMLKGPAGCGKTHMAGEIAKAMNKRFGHISGSAGASESQLIGRLLPTGDGGKFEYHQSPFVDMYENGGVFLFDEMDAFDPNTLLVVNTATANGGFMVEARSAQPNVTRHAETVLLAAVNTFGTGADAQYVGRFALDAATLDRWYVVEMDYHEEFEATLFGGDPKNKQQAGKWNAALAPSKEEIKQLGDWVWNLRTKARAANLKRIVSTRMIQKLVAARIAGVPTAEVKADLTAGWSRDEKSKVGIAA